ncbi:MAG: sortase [Candidatus Curtissbacteria bacterium]|nr:sortase [Candidatus Curtissbacteria bacterium]
MLITLGALVLLWKSLPALHIPATQVQQEEANAQINQPLKIYVPKISKVLNITDGYVIDNRWTISENGVSFYTNSASPGGSGNTVIYGHNRRDILGNLEKVKTGDSVYIVQASGNFIKYEITETKKVEPQQVEILNQSVEPKLTIYTCSGYLDQARFVVIATPVS